MWNKMVLAGYINPFLFSPNKSEYGVHQTIFRQWSCAGVTHAALACACMTAALHYPGDGDMMTSHAISVSGHVIFNFCKITAIKPYIDKRTMRDTQ